MATRIDRLMGGPFGVPRPAPRSDHRPRPTQVKGLQMGPIPERVGSRVPPIIVFPARARSPRLPPMIRAKTLFPAPLLLLSVLSGACAGPSAEAGHGPTSSTPALSTGGAAP